MIALGVDRAGTYYRVFKPDWSDPLDASFAKTFGGRWTPRGELGAVYLNATIEVSAANARLQHRRRAIGLFDLRPEKRPSLLDVRVPRHLVGDVVTSAGIAAAGLPSDYPIGVSHASCWAAARAAYADTRLAGIACRSAAECTATYCAGEELAWFDRAKPVARIQERTFARWYPGPYPH